MTSRPVAVSLVILDDRAIRRLNRRFLGHDDATDVISFNLQPGTGNREPETGNGEPGTPFGEVYVSADTAAREAKARGIDPAEELLRYAIHGMLHLFGHDDHRPADRRRMWARQEALVREVQKLERGRNEGNRR
jgi:probable rRNA maturation factor